MPHRHHLEQVVSLLQLRNQKNICQKLFPTLDRELHKNEKNFINFLRKFSRTRYALAVCGLPNIIDVWAPAWGVLTKTFIGIVRYRRMPKWRPSSVCTWMKWRAKWKANKHFSHFVVSLWFTQKYATYNTGMNCKGKEKMFMRN